MIVLKHLICIAHTSGVFRLTPLQDILTAPKMQTGAIFPKKNCKHSSNIPTASILMKNFEIAQLSGVYIQTVKTNIKAILKSGIVVPDYTHSDIISHPFSSVCSLLYTYLVIW